MLSALHDFGLLHGFSTFVQSYTDGKAKFSAVRILFILRLLIISESQGLLVNESGTGNITQLLIDLTNGNRTAVDDLLPLIYGELRSLAANYLRRERPEHTLQPTALVHEAYLRLVDQTQVSW